MPVEQLESLQKELKHELFIYPWEIFELRIQEEMLRADRSDSCFGYMEIPMQALREVIKPEIDDRAMWRFVFTYLAEALRGSDIKGFLSEDKGLGIVVLDSTLVGAQECRSRLWAKLVQELWLVPDAPSSPEFLKVTRYPLEVST